MGNYCYLEIIKKKKEVKKILEIEGWKNTIPKENSIFNFIFNESDFISNKETCYFRVKISDVLDRLKLLNLDEKTIIKDISKFFEISEKDAKLALLINEFSEDLRESFKEFALENHIELWKDEDYEEATDEFNKYLEIEEKLDLIDITNIRQLYYYNCIFKKYNEPDYYLQLNFTESTMLGFEIETCKKIIIPEISQKIEINKEYLFMAKKHFSEHHYDLVYIELIIILERALKQSIVRMKATKNFSSKDIEKIFIDLSLMNLLKFLLYYLNTSSITIKEFEQIHKLYNVRNNIIHSNQKRFSRLECAKSIRLIEKLLTELSNLR